MSPFQGPIGNNQEKWEFSGVRGRVVERFNRRAVALVGETQATQVLDVGTGEGHLIKRIVDENPAVHALGTDADDPRLRRYWEEFRSPRLSFRVADATKLPFEDNSFQVVTAFEVLEHLDDPVTALSEIRRVCKGMLIASVPWEPFWRAGNMLTGQYVKAGGNTPGHVQHWSKRGFRRLLEQYGRIDSVQTCAPWTLARVRLMDRD